MTDSATPAEALPAALRDEVERGLQALDLPASPPSLYDPIRYVLTGGGKRIRPVALLLAAHAFGGREARRHALSAALGVEVFHNFTLVHDDIMDHAATRRGRPTVHTTWGEAEAILAGDLMHGLAARLIHETPLSASAGARARALFDRMVVRLCEGQALDLAFETQDDVSVEDYLGMIDRKTGALLDLSLELGALCGGASDDALVEMRRAGHALGRAFQIQDDLLDLTAEHADWGKTIGGDLMVGKRTFLLLSALERSRGDDHAWWTRALAGLPESELPEARTRLERLGVLADTAAAVGRYAQEGLSALGVLPGGPASEALLALSAGLVGRKV